jgi:excisionase family DNA binding protein
VAGGEESLGLTVGQVAEFLCVEPDDVTELLERGTLAGIKAAGHEWRIPWESVEEFLGSAFDERRDRPLLRRWADPRTWDRAHTDVTKWSAGWRRETSEKRPSGRSSRKPFSERWPRAINAAPSRSSIAAGR